MPPDDLGGDGRLDVGQVEHAGLRGELRVEHDLEPQVAELARELGRGTRLERVVHLVRLLEKVAAQGLMGLLPIPRAAVGRPETVADGRHRPRSEDRRLGGEGRQVEGRRQVRLRELTDRRRVCCPEPPDGVIERVGAHQHVTRLAPARAVPAGQRHRGGGIARGRRAGGSEHGERHHESRSRRLQGRGDEALGRDDLQAGGRIEAEPESRLGDEGVQHVRAASPRPR